ncbi:helix-turn-helix domain-containing protein [uncultured Lactobacillus sp.]|uniref:helix-turn-helix domain-containing protein n=1 Tax=uncultured Lactobacillus sp. TaxID=153152 RepID=UPI002638DA5A|nr:helix-turn-helix transcriptional regulator [uncultured Lactobacillus sp.]
MLLDRIKERAKKFDKSLQDVAEETGISPNTIYSWRKKTPRMDKLQQVADLLHTTTDYLSGATDDPSLPSSSESTISIDEDKPYSYHGYPVPEKYLKMIRGLMEDDIKEGKIKPDDKQQ